MAALLKGHGVEAPYEEEMLAGVLHQELWQAGQGGWAHRQLLDGIGTSRTCRHFHCSAKSNGLGRVNTYRTERVLI